MVINIQRNGIKKRKKEIIRFNIKFIVKQFEILLCFTITLNSIVRYKYTHYTHYSIYNGHFRCEIDAIPILITMAQVNSLYSL